jgi:hypothetical protein
VASALAGRVLVITVVDGARDTVVEGARVEGVLDACPLTTAALDVARVIGLEVVVPRRVTVERETACGPDLGREVSPRVERGTVDAARIVLDVVIWVGRVVFFDDGRARVTSGTGLGFGTGLARENGLSSSDCMQQESRSE